MAHNFPGFSSADNSMWQWQCSLGTSSVVRVQPDGRHTFSYLLPVQWLTLLWIFNQFHVLKYYISIKQNELMQNRSLLCQWFMLVTSKVQVEIHSTCVHTHTHARTHAHTHARTHHTSGENMAGLIIVTAKSAANVQVQSLTIYNT